MNQDDLPPLYERTLGFCETCGYPVHTPEYQATLPDGYKGCTCESPATYTWEQGDRDYAEWKKGEAARIEAYNASHHVRPNDFSVWKKRAKNL